MEYNYTMANPKVTYRLPGSLPPFAGRPRDDGAVMQEVVLNLDSLDFRLIGRGVNIVGAGTTVAKTGSGVLLSVVVNKAVSLGTITLYDNTAGSGEVIGTITFPVTLLASQIALPYHRVLTTGLTIVTTGDLDISVIFQ